MQIRYRYVHEDVDRHGNVRVYFWRRPGPKVRLTEAPGSEEFSRRYHELLAGNAVAARRDPTRPQPGTLRWLAVEHMRSAAFRSLDEMTQRKRRQVLDRICDEPVDRAKPSGRRLADMPVAFVTAKSLRALRDRRHDKPGAANDRVKAIRAVFKWATATEGTGVVTNPARDLEKIRVAGGGHRTWAIEDVERFEGRHPVGSRARLALAILVYTGMRRSDVAQLGRQHISRDPVAADDGGTFPGWISKPMWKGRRRHAQRIEIPLLAPLAAAIDATEAPTHGRARQALSLLVTEHGRAFSIAGFGNWFHDRCQEAGLVGLSAHGLRKAAATRAAEAGATAHQLMSMFGWLTLQESERYTKAANRKRLATSGMGLMSAADARTENATVPTIAKRADERTKKG